MADVLSQLEGLINSLDIATLRACQQLLNRTISDHLQLGSSKSADSTFLSANSNVDIKNPEDYVKLHEQFIDSTDNELLTAELQSLNFQLKTSSDAVQNRFLSHSSEDYVWSSKRGPVTQNPLNLDKFPVTKRIMALVNQKFDCNMNSVLVSCYASGSVNARLHSDDERTLDSRQPICVLSLGTTRKVEFVAEDKKNKRQSDLSIAPPDSSIYIMKPGCQKYFKHRVRMDNKNQEHRISLSFRCFVPATKTEQIEDIKEEPHQAAENITGTRINDTNKKRRPIKRS